MKTLYIPPEIWYNYGMKDRENTTNRNETIEFLRAENRAQKERIAELEHQIELLTEAVRLARHKRFGASSEQSSEDTLEYLGCLFNEAEVYADQEAKEANDSVVVAAHKRHKKHEYTLDKLPENIPIRNF